MEKNLNEHSKMEQLERLLKFPETVTPEELEAWMEDEEFLALYRTAMDTRRVLLEKEALPDVKSAFQAFRNKEMQPEVLPVRKPVLRRSRYLWAGVAAAACILLCVAFFVGTKWSEASQPVQVYVAQSNPDDVILSVGEQTIPLTSGSTDSLVASLSLTMSLDNELHYDKKEEVDEPVPVLHTLTTPQGKDFHLVLSDGTRVWVNAGSSLTYPSFFAGDTRSIQLQGEAYFEVAKDAEHPFVVETGTLQTTVLGTSFNVRCYEQEPSHVTLVEGSVKVAHQQESVTLEPGQDAMLGLQGNLTARSVDVESFICWKDGMFYFDGVPFRQMMADLGRWYGLNVVFSQASHLNDALHLHAEKGWDIHEIIQQINLISDTKVRLEGQTIVVE